METPSSKQKQKGNKTNPNLKNKEKKEKESEIKSRGGGRRRRNQIESVECGHYMELPLLRNTRKTRVRWGGGRNWRNSSSLGKRGKAVNSWLNWHLSINLEMKLLCYYLCPWPMKAKNKRRDRQQGNSKWVSNTVVSALAHSSDARTNSARPKTGLHSCANQSVRKVRKKQKTERKIG